LDKRENENGELKTPEELSTWEKKISKTVLRESPEGTDDPKRKHAKAVKGKRL